MQNESSSDSLNSTGKAKILLVDDDPNVNEVLELMLSQIGYDVTAVSHGQEAITLFKQGNYDLVITDLGMPDVSGWDVAEAVKQRKILEKLKEHQWQRHLKEEDIRETKEGDELATVRYVFDRESEAQTLRI